MAGGRVKAVLSGENVLFPNRKTGVARKFFEKGVQREKIFFKKFFPSGRGAGTESPQTR